MTLYKTIKKLRVFMEICPEENLRQQKHYMHDIQYFWKNAYFQSILTKSHDLVVLL